MFTNMFQGKPALVEPIDFESYILKNKMLIQNDPQRELLLYPPDDVSVSRLRYSGYCLGFILYNSYYRTSYFNCIILHTSLFRPS